MRDLWKSPPIPYSVMANEAILWDIRSKVEVLSAEDEPSGNDLATLFHRYNESSVSKRDAIDAAFVWMTGYTLASICAMVVTPEGKDYEKTLEKWRKSGS